MRKTRSKKKILTLLDSDNKEHLFNYKLNNKINIKAKPVLTIYKIRAKQKEETSLHFNDEELRVNEKVNPDSIKTLSNEELHVNTEEPNKDIINIMFKKI